MEARSSKTKPVLELNAADKTKKRNCKTEGCSK